MNKIHCGSIHSTSSASESLDGVLLLPAARNIRNTGE